MLQLVRGLCDPAILERVLQEGASMEGGNLSLAKVVKLVEALEIGKQNHTLVSKAAGLCRSGVSEHQKQKQTGQQERHEGCQRDTQAADSRTTAPKLKDNRGKCKAYDTQCNSLGRNRDSRSTRSGDRKRVSGL